MFFYAGSLIFQVISFLCFDRGGMADQVRTIFKLSLQKNVLPRVFGGIPKSYSEPGLVVCFKIHVGSST